MTEQDAHIESIIWKFHSREITDEELRFLELWLDNPANQKTFNEISKIYFAGLVQPVIHSFDIDNAWSKVASRTIERRKTINRNGVFRSMLLAAAVLIAGVFIWWLQHSASDRPEMWMSYAAVDSSIQVTLPDGSRIDLREGSSLEVLDGFGEINRSVYLQGEAYFEVERNTQLPFKINTENSLTEVLGTSFLLRETEDGSTNLIVYSGKVRFADAENREYLVLEKNEHASINHNSEIIDSVDETLNPLYWKNKELSYRGASVNEVFEEMEMLFDLNISYDPNISGNCRFTGRFQKADAAMVLAAVCESFNWQYFTTGNTVIINNTVCE